MRGPELAASGRRQALTALVPVLPRARSGLEARLELRNNEWRAGLRGSRTTHSAKLALVPDANESGGEASTWLLLETSFDGELERHLGELWDHAGAVLVDLLGSCAGADGLDGASFRALVERHARRALAACSAHGALPASVIDNDARLDRLSQAYLDGARPPRSLEPLALMLALREHLEATGEVWLGSLALPPPSAPEQPPLHGMSLALARRVLDPKRAGTALPRDPAGVAQGAQTSSLWLLPPPSGRFQRWARATWLDELRRRDEPDPGLEPRELARVHSARWVRLPDERLLVSLTHDGTSQAFRALLPKALPRELWTPVFELSPQIWYSAYPDLSVNDVLRNHRIRELLSRPLDARSARALAGMF